MTTDMKNITTTYKTLDKRKKTKRTGIYYREIQKTVIDENGKIKTSISDKLYIIKFKDIDDKWRTKTIGKYSEGIRENYCKTQRDLIANKVKFGEQPPIIKKKIKKEVLTLDGVFQIYKNNKNEEGKVSRAIEGMYKANIFKKFGKVDINSISTDKIVIFRKSLIDKGLADATIKGNITFIGTLFNVAIEEGLYDKVNPIKSKRLKFKTLDNKRERYLTLEEINRLYEAIEGLNEQDNMVLWLFTQLSLHTGGRLETILNIKKKDFDLINKTITLYDFKRKSTYTGFISDELHNYLKDYLMDLKPNTFVIGSRDVKYATRTISRKLKNIIDELFNDGLELRDRKNRAVIHSLRHTFASHLAINGVPIFTIKELMNHANIEMTLRYAKLSPDNGKVAVQGLYK